MATPVVTGHGAKGRRFFLWRGMTHGIAVVPEADSAAGLRTATGQAAQVTGFAISAVSPHRRHRGGPRHPRPRRRNLPHLPEPIGARRPPSTAYAVLGG